MCGIAGFYNPHDHYLKEKIHYETVLADMAGRQRHRGPDDSGLYLAEHGGLSHAACPLLICPAAASPW